LVAGVCISQPKSRRTRRLSGPAEPPGAVPRRSRLMPQSYSRPAASARSYAPKRNGGQEAGTVYLGRHASPEAASGLSRGCTNISRNCEMVKATTAAQRQREQLVELARAAIECGAPVRRIERGVSGVPEKELRAERKGQRPSIKKDMSRGMKNIFCSAAES
jgi:hypothetical protein